MMALLALALVVTALLSGRALSRNLAGGIVAAGIILISAIILPGLLVGNLGQLSQPLWGTSAFVALLLVYGLTFRTQSERSSLRIIYPGHYASGLSVLLVVLIGLAITIVVVSEPGNVDDLFYHYPKLFHLRESGSFAPTGLELVDGYPQNGELFGYFFGSLLGAFTVIDGYQLLILPLYLAAVWLIGASQRLNFRTNCSAALLGLFVPAVWSVAITVHSDLFASTLVLTALALLFATGQWNRATHLILYGLTLGLMLGTKFIALPWLAVLLLGLLLSPLRPHSPKEFLLTALPLILLGGQSYILNAVRFGNPLYPYPIDLLDLHLPGQRHSLNALWEDKMTSGYSSSAKIINSWFSLEAISQSNHEHWFGGFGVMWPILFVATLFALYFAFRTRDRLFLLLTIISIALFIVTPARFTTRFVLFLPAIGAIGFGKVIDSLTSPRSELLKIFLLSVTFGAALHCIQQNLHLLTQELGSEHRGQTLLDSCRNSATPLGLRRLIAEYQDAVRNVKELSVVLGSERADREMSFACLWPLAPEARITFYTAEPLNIDAQILKSTESPHLVIINQIGLIQAAIPAEFERLTQQDNFTAVLKH